MKNPHTITDVILTKYSNELMSLLTNFISGNETLITYVSEISKITQVTFNKEFAACGIQTGLLVDRATSLAILGLAHTMASQMIKQLNGVIGNA